MQLRLRWIWSTGEICMWHWVTSLLYGPGEFEVIDIDLKVYLPGDPNYSLNSKFYFLGELREKGN